MSRPDGIPIVGAIVAGDVLDLFEHIADESIDLIIADPPYYDIAAESWDRQWESLEAWARWCLAWGSEIYRVLKPAGSAYIFGDDKNIAHMQVKFDILKWRLINNIVWNKTNYTMRKSGPADLRSYQIQAEERILFYGKDQDFKTFGQIVTPMAAASMAHYLRKLGAFFKRKKMKGRHRKTLLY